MPILCCIIITGGYLDGDWFFLSNVINIEVNIWRNFTMWKLFWKLYSVVIVTQIIWKFFIKDKDIIKLINGFKIRLNDVNKINGHCRMIIEITILSIFISQSLMNLCFINKVNPFLLMFGHWRIFTILKVRFDRIIHFLEGFIIDIWLYFPNFFFL